MGVKLKEISFMFDSEIGLFHKGKYIGKCHEMSTEHWIFECDVVSIRVGEYRVGIYTI